MPNYPLRLQAIKVSQPLGEFFVVSIEAATLRTVTFLDPTRINEVDRKGFWYSLLGAQRQPSTRRAKQIAKYIDTVEAAFPNSIILAANYINYGEFQEDDTKRWRIEVKGRSRYELIIPSSEKMASVIDGQHRLLGFDFCRPDRLEMELVCAVYMDLPHAYQAYLFATININQRKVDKSLAYDQFGYNLDDEQREGWAPDKIAVYFSRRLNLDPESPFYGHIKVAPLNAELLFPKATGWQVSMACVVEGIAKLISQNPKGDRDLLHREGTSSRTRNLLPKDTAPLRSLYLSGKDEEVYRLVKKFFNLAKEHLWQRAKDASYIQKTVGIQALFDLFRVVVEKFGIQESENYFGSMLDVSSSVDFSDDAYQASGKGRVRIKNTLLLYANLISRDQLPPGDAGVYSTIERKYPRK